MNKQAVKSMFTLAFYLVALVVGWIVIGKLVFPSSGTEDSYIGFVQKYESLLTQVAENTLDPEQWSGIQSTGEVQDILKEGKIYHVVAIDGLVRFYLEQDVPDLENYMWFAYDQSGTHIFGPGDVNSGSDNWTKVDAPAGVERWEGGPMGKSYINIRQLTNHFHLIEAYLPT